MIAPDALQLAFHEVECATYDQRFAIVYDDRTLRAAARDVSELVRIAPTARVLDVGCGTGYLAVGLAATARAASVHASDLSPGMLGRARTNARDHDARVHLVRATAARLPYRDGSFDTVVARGVLHHLHDPVAALVEWRRVTRRGGHVVLVSEPTPTADRAGGAIARATLAGLALTRRAAGRLGRPLSAHPPEVAEVQHYWDLVALAANLHTFRPPELASLAREAGFARASIRATGLVAIGWLVVHYVLAGELPRLAASRKARRRSAAVYAGLREVDRLLGALLPSRTQLTVSAVLAV